jgi:hypothetical protein
MPRRVRQVIRNGEVVPLDALLRAGGESGER